MFMYVIIWSNLIVSKTLSAVAWNRIGNASMIWEPGGRLNKKDGLTGYGDSHVKDKTS